jgi:putative ABC transport system permease protein
VGATRRQVVGQFLGESVLLAIAALLLSLVLAQAALPRLNALVEGRYLLDGQALAGIVPGLAGLLVLVGLAAGLYPAFYLSAFQPAHVLKARGAGGRASGAALRKALVVFQFGVSILLIIGTAVVYEQLRFIGRKNLGFDPERFVVLPLFRADREAKTNRDPWHAARYNEVKREFLQSPAVTAATAFRSLPGEDRFFVRLVVPEGHEGVEWRMPVQECDEDFFGAFGVPLLAGRTFSPGIERDRTHAYILNESAVKALGWTVQDAVGKRFGRSRSEDDANGQVIGVVGDFHIASLRDPIGPQCFAYRQWFFDHLGLRLSGGNLPAAMAFIEARWKALMRPDQPLQVAFLDDVTGRQYLEERRLGRIVGAFSLLAVGLACTGLFGLAAYAIEQRIREIGIRKVLGASDGSLLALVSGQFVRLVALGCLLAWPLAFLLMGRWLDGFAYRTTLDPLTFLAAGLAAVAIAVLTVGGHALRAARANPVDTLRSE